MKNTNSLARIIKFHCLICLIFACQKESIPEIIGVSNGLTAYEKYLEDINSGKIDNSAFIYTNDGGSIYFDYDYSFGTGSVIISKFDSSGLLLWKSRYGSLEKSPFINEIRQIRDGAILLVGKVTKWINDSSEYVTDITLVKINKNGELLWEKNYNYAKNDEGYSVYQTNDEGFIIAGSVGDNDRMYADDWHLTKTDEKGEPEWSKTYASLNAHEYALKIIQTDDNGYLVAIGALGNSENPEYAELVKIDQYGNIIKYIDFPFSDFRSPEMIKANDGGYIIGMVHNSTSSDLKVIGIIKMDYLGDNIIWRKEIFPNHEPSYLKWEKTLYFRNLLNTGYFAIYGHSDIPDYGHYSILKFNNSGDLIE